MAILYNVLIIDDHPLIIDSYKNAFLELSSKNDEIEFNIDTAHSCDSGYLKVKEASKKNDIDIIFLDIKLPSSKTLNILSGEDLGAKIRELLVGVKIIVSTSYNNSYRLNNIFRSVDPDGFLIKNDLKPDELILAIEETILNPPYYSRTVLQLMRKYISCDFYLDTIDRKILYELSHGTKISELPEIIPLSKTAIERRKRALKELFEVEDKSDRHLFIAAKEKGFI